MDFAVGFDLVKIAMFLIALLISMSVHEAIHGLVAYKLGDDTAEREGRLTLNPFAHIDPVLTILLPTVLVIFGLPPILAAKPVPFNPNRVRFEEFGAAIVGISGPLSNLLIAISLAPLLAVLDVGSYVHIFVLLMIKLNIGLFVFNMLPIPPLDGSRLLYAFSPEPIKRFLEQLESFGLFLLIGILLLLGPVIAPIINSIYVPLVNLLT